MTNWTKRRLQRRMSYSCTLKIVIVSRSQTHLPSAVLALVTIAGCLLSARPTKEMQKWEDLNSLSTGDPPYVFPDNATPSTNKSVLYLCEVFFFLKRGSSLRKKLESSLPPNHLLAMWVSLLYCRFWKTKKKVCDHSLVNSLTTVCLGWATY